jgi:homoserine dehydrogenase
MINVAILGYGVIGSGVFEVLSTNADIVKRNAGQEIQVTRVLDLRKFPGSPVEEILTDDFEDILNDESVDIVVEAMGGTGVAYKFVKASLEAGKSVATSNKALVAAHGPELLQIAAGKNVNFMFEASVGGGIPVIRPLLSCITADRIQEITGILNGTTNFILSKMYDEGSRFEPTLEEAQMLGYAEADPTEDIEGYDACRKIAILTALVKGQYVDFEDLSCTGITGISDIDIAYAKALGMKIKLLATSRTENNHVYGEVAPCMIGKDNPLYSVDGVMNAVLVRGNMLGDIMFYGAGAGALPTASAVVSDIIAQVRYLNRNIPVKMAPEKLDIACASELADRFFVRIAKDINVKAVLPVEREIAIAQAPDEKAVITGIITKKDLMTILEALPGLIGYIKVR